MGKNRKQLATEPLPQANGWFMHIYEFNIIIDDNDDIGCSFKSDSRQVIREVAEKVRKLNSFLVPDKRKIKWHPDLLALGFEPW